MSTTTNHLSKLFSITILIFLGSITAVAQDGLAPALGQSSKLDHTFLDEDGEVVIVGQLQSLQGSTAIIKFKGKEMKFNLNQFSKKEQRWIRQKVAEMKKRELKRPEINKLAVGLANNKSTIVIKTCNRLKSYGPAASHIATQLDPHIQDSDARVRSAAFLCLLSIAEDHPVAIGRIVNEINQNDPLVNSFESKPTRILGPFSRFGIHGLPYLGAVAFSGQLDVEESDPSEIEAATNLDATGAKTRIAACRAIANSNAEEDAANLLLEVLQAEVASNNENKQVGEIFECLGKLGFQSDAVLSAIQENVAEAPEQAKKAVADISQANQKK